MEIETGSSNLLANKIRQRIAAGETTAESVVTTFIERIKRRETDLRAWEHFNADHALAQARALDAAHRPGAQVGPLHGVPIGIKDVIDTYDMPTENGTVLDRGRQPTEDAALVSLLRQAGAVIMGKTVTTELALYAPKDTRNPHDESRTPGGSSSGSAAAVAAGMVPLAIGTQTNGSVIRPASFCGVVGFKPTRGRISLLGVLELSKALDTIGVFGRSIQDVALTVDVLSRLDTKEQTLQSSNPVALSRAAVEPPPAKPRFGLTLTPYSDRLDSSTTHAIIELEDRLGHICERVELPSPAEDAIELHATIMHADISKNFAAYSARGMDRLSERLQDIIAEGLQVSASDYNRALERVAYLNAGLDRLFDQYDALIVPAAAGEAPIGFEFTGDPVFCTTWTMCGTPSITLPLLSGPSGLPVGIQLIGRLGDDSGLLRAARWLQRVLK